MDRYSIQGRSVGRAGMYTIQGLNRSQKLQPKGWEMRLRTVGPIREIVLQIYSIRIWFDGRSVGFWPYTQFGAWIVAHFLKADSSDDLNFSRTDPENTDINSSSYA